jgi:hypothetical protein
MADKYWLRPPLVLAPSPHDRAKLITLEISQVFLRTNVTAKRISPVYWVWAHVVGELPPINNVSRFSQVAVVPTLMTLEQSIACFQGVGRPYDDEEHGESILVYVLNPAVSLDRDTNLVCPAKAVRVPSNTCLTVQVKPTDALQNSRTALNSATVTRNFDTEDVETIHGVVTRLEFIPGTGDRPVLPRKYEERYHRRLW